MTMEMITSNKNEKIKNISALLKSKKERDEQGVFVIEGSRIVKDTINTVPRSIDSIFIGENVDLSIYEADNADIFRVKDSVLNGISGTVTSQGVMAIVKKPVYSFEGILNGSNKKTGIRILALENVQDPGNLGTMLRTAEAAGMTGIIMSSDCADIFSPKVVRSSMGSVFRMPFIYVSDFTAALDSVKERNVSVYAAYLHGGVSYKEIEYTQNYAILIGNEGNGLSDAAVEKADKRIFIPMAGQIESLNAAIAAAILMYK